MLVYCYVPTTTDESGTAQLVSKAMMPNLRKFAYQGPYCYALTTTVNVQTALDNDKFIEALNTLMNELKVNAAAGDSLLKFPTGGEHDRASQYVSSGSSGKIGGTVFMPMCRYNYDLQRFYNVSTLVIPPPPPSSPPTLSFPATPPVLSPQSSVKVRCLYLYLLKNEKEKEAKAHATKDNEVRAATNNFSEDNKLGQDGFGAIYKGTLGDGSEITIKRLARGSGQDLTKRTLLDRQKRYKIIEGIAKGLLYLHEDSRLMIIHRDMKANNVLLDMKMNLKIADFGMTRLFNHEETQGQASRIVGT
ncbi:hypothetical protein QVD17_03838 [Tagetes erecta]|uniref:non-specific serine/threonine protein kinase n=1 Tax=Tagetes erecta TaxID=13708 RepID=A0AAD8LAQ8_TARER|nr:hypothetical protein QVD17_03838 [Tagetes erecta]